MVDTGHSRTSGRTRARGDQRDGNVPGVWTAGVGGCFQEAPRLARVVALAGRWETRLSCGAARSLARPRTSSHLNSSSLC